MWEQYWKINLKYINMVNMIMWENLWINYINVKIDDWEIINEYTFLYYFYFSYITEIYFRFLINWIYVKNYWNFC